jgi:hypothetical protein
MAVGLAAVLSSVKLIELDHGMVSSTAEPLELEASVDAPHDDLQSLQWLLDDAPAQVAVTIDPADVFSQKSVEELTDDDIRELIRLSTEQAEQRSPKEQVDALAWLLKVEQAVVSEESAAEITDKVKQTLGVEEREFEPRLMAKLNELDSDTVVPLYRITEQPVEIVQVIDLNPDGDYRIVEEKPLYQLYDVELAEYRRYLDAAPDGQAELLQAMMKREDPRLEATAETTRHFRTTPRPAGKYFQVINVDAQGRYRIMTEKPEAKMTILERARLRAFQLTEDPRFKRYREAVLGAAENEIEKP